MGALMLCLCLSDCITQASHTKEYTVLAFSQFFFQRRKTYCYAKVMVGGGGFGSSFKEVPYAPCWRKPVIRPLLPPTTA